MQRTCTEQNVAGALRRGAKPLMVLAVLPVVQGAAALHVAARSPLGDMEPVMRVLLGAGVGVDVKEDKVGRMGRQPVVGARAIVGRTHTLPGAHSVHPHMPLYAHHMHACTSILRGTMPPPSPPHAHPPASNWLQPRRRQRMRTELGSCTFRVVGTPETRMATLRTHTAVQLAGREAAVPRSQPVGGMVRACC